MKKVKMSVIDYNPNLVKEWSPKNSKDPNNVSYGSHKEVIWECEKCGLEWTTPVYSRTIEKKGCPVCHHHQCHEKDSLHCKVKAYSNVWDFSKNKIDPKEIKPNSRTNAYWECPHCSQSFKKRVRDMVNHPICPSCHKPLFNIKNSLAEKKPELACQWDYERNDPRFCPEVVSACSNKSYYFKCTQCGVSELRIPNKISKGLLLCRKCNIVNRTSFREQAILYYTRRYFENGSCEVLSQYKSSEGHEIDVYIPSLNVGIAFDGAVHRDTVQRDIEIQESIRKHGIKLFVISEVNKNKSEFVFYVEKNDEKMFSATIKNVFERIDSSRKYDVDVERDYQYIYKSYFEYLMKTKALKMSLAEYSSDIIKEFDFNKNVLRPENIPFDACVELNWKCKRGHSFKMTANKRTKQNTKCPYCQHRRLDPKTNSLKALFPDLVTKRWDYGKNDELGIFPDQIFKSDRRKVYWLGVQEPRTTASMIRSWLREQKRKGWKKNTCKKTCEF